jgi:transcriptional regulator with XRE-family HTH domain
MMTLDDIVKALHDRKATVVAQEVGLSYQTVWRVARGETKNVSYDTAKKLSDYLNNKGK